MKTPRPLPVKSAKSAKSAAHAHARGLTLIEILITLALVAVLATVAAPAFKRMIDTQRLRSINAALVTDLQFARAEAVSRNQRVFISFDQTGTALTCYVILTGDFTGCNCKNQPGVDVCVPSAAQELRTVQVERGLGITVGVPSAQTTTQIGFDPATGRLLVVYVDSAQPALSAFNVEVKNASIGGFVNALEVTGKPSVCSPSGQMSGVTAC